MSLKTLESISAEEVISILNLKQHPEGGYFAETFRDVDTIPGTSRAVSTQIYYLLKAGQRSHWHRIDAVEVWHYYAGSSMQMTLSWDDGKLTESQVLGPNLQRGERPQIVVQTRQWQSAQSLGDWTLVGCSVAPGFVYEGFQLAPQDWAPRVK